MGLRLHLKRLPGRADKRPHRVTGGKTRDEHMFSVSPPDSGHVGSPVEPRLRENALRVLRTRPTDWVRGFLKAAVASKPAVSSQSATKEGPGDEASLGFPGPRRRRS